MTLQPKRLYSKYKYIWEQCDNTMDSLYAFIQNYPSIGMDKYGNITVKNTSEDIPLPVFCCHLDTVHKEAPKPELLGTDVLFSFNGNGIGGDDKCGIVACLELLERVPCKVIFFRDEESGCLGSREYDAESLKNDLFCIEIDRRNANDLIVAVGGTKMCSDEFVERLRALDSKLAVALGAYTDISKLCKAEINMLNISSGYYNPHTDDEYVVLSELNKNIDTLEAFAKDVIKNPLKEREYKRNEIVASYQSYQTRYWNGKTGYQRTTEPDLYSGYGSDDYSALQYGEREENERDFDFPGEETGASSDPAEAAANREALEWFRQQKKKNVR